MSIIGDNHTTTGTMLLVTIHADMLASLAEAVTRADLEGRDLSLALEIEPQNHGTAALKVKVGSGTWTTSLGNTLVRTLPLYDN